MSHKNVFYALLLFLVIGCKEKVDDPCSLKGSPTCGELITEDPESYKSQISPNKILDVTVNPSNPVEIAFVGQPDGYQEQHLFIKNLSTGDLNPIALIPDGIRVIPDWGINGKILFPFGNRTILRDGTDGGAITGCPNQIGLNPKWCRDATSIAVISTETSTYGDLLLIDLTNDSIQNIGPMEVPFSVSPDGSKIAAVTEFGKIRWKDFATRTEHSLETGEGVVRGCDWMPDSKTLVWTIAVDGENVCRKRTVETSIFLTDVISGLSTRIATSCYWHQYYHVKSSPAGDWIYFFQNDIEKGSDETYISNFRLYRIKSDGSLIEMVAS